MTPKHEAALCPFGAATASLAKFKAAQDLHIETKDLPTSPTPLAGTSSSTTSSTFTTPGTDTSSCVTPETPVPPSSTGKKRRRRTAAQIDRKFSCTFPGCTKAYGSEGSLTQHQRLKHSEQMQDAAAGNQKGLFPPPHSTKGRGSRSGGANSAATAARTAAGASRVRTIRPVAAMEGIVSPLAFELAALGSGGSASVLPPASEPLVPAPVSASTRHRQNLRSRSNSMPVSFTTPTPVPTLVKQTSTSSSSSTSSGACAPRPQTTRKSRTTSTPRSSGKSASGASSRRGKCRSKSETLGEMDVFLAFGDIESAPSSILRSGRSASDSFMRSASLQDVLAMTPTPPPAAGDSTASPLHHAFSFDWSSSMASDSPSSNDQAIDSEILSVLADCDSSDLGESSPASEFSSAPPSATAPGFGDDHDMLLSPATPPPTGLASFDVQPVPLAPAYATGGLRINDLFRRARELEAANPKCGVALAELTPVEVKHDSWAAAASAPSSSGSRTPRVDPGYLSTHLEKMSMLQPQVPRTPVTGGHSGTEPPHASPSSLVALLHGPATDELHDIAAQRQCAAETRAPAGAAALSASDEQSLPGEMASLEDFAADTTEAFAVKGEVPELEPEAMDVCDAVLKDESDAVHTQWHARLKRERDDTARATDAEQQQQLQWMLKDYASAAAAAAPACWTALENQYVDELFQETMSPGHHGPRDWKVLASAAEAVIGETHGLEHHHAQSDKFASSSGHHLSEMLFDVADFGLEDTRMGSPLLMTTCQQEEL